LFVKQIVNINFRDIFYIMITKALYKLVQMMDRGYLGVKNQAFGANRPAFRSKVVPPFRANQRTLAERCWTNTVA
jgi:hypothetical protein